MSKAGIKKIIGKYKNKPVVIGDRNLVTLNEILYEEGVLYKRRHKDFIEYNTPIVKEVIEQ